MCPPKKFSIRQTAWDVTSDAGDAKSIVGSRRPPADHDRRLRQKLSNRRGATISVKTWRGSSSTNWRSADRGRRDDVRLAGFPQMGPARHRDTTVDVRLWPDSADFGDAATRRPSGANRS